MNKIKNHLYTPIFWISRIITVSIFGTCFFAVLNARYMWSESFFPILKSLLFINCVGTSGYLANRVDILKHFVIYINYNLYFIVYLIILLLLAKILFKKIKNSIITVFCICLSILSYILFAKLCFNMNINIMFILFIIFVYSILFVSNFKLSKIPKIIMLIPIISDILFINHILSYIKKVKEQNIVYMIFNANIIILLFLSLIISVCDLENSYKYKIVDGVFYSMDIDEDKIIFNEENDKQIYSYNMDLNEATKHNKLDMKITLQSFALNKKLKECYIYDESSGNFFILDSKNDFNIKQKIPISQQYGDLHSHERVLYDEFNNNIVIVMEAGIVYILNNFSTIASLTIPDRSDWVIYNPFRNSYLISYWYNEPYLTEISASNYNINNIDAPKMQGYIALSKRNKEIYIAFHQQGTIAVYDAETMKLKRKIKSNYSVKDITYDEDLNVLIAPAYFTGYIDIFLMDGSDKLLTRQFVGYILREAKFDTKKENLYVCSWHGLQKVPIDIKDLITKYSNNSRKIK